MKNKLWKMLLLNGVLASSMVVTAGAPVSVLAADSEEETTDSDSGEDLQVLFDQSVEDAMIIDDNEILPVVSLDEGQPYAVYDEEGRILLYSFHKYPDSYPDRADVKLEWGNVWTFKIGRAHV